MNRHVLVVGGGAAGLMAAGCAARSGARVTLLEKMPAAGRKLAITGKGRCNLTNIASVRDFIPHFGPNGKFLYQAFSSFFSDELLDFFHGLGIETVTERGGRVFPASSEAMDIVNALTAWNRREGVQIRTRTPVNALIVKQGRVQGVQTQPAQDSREPCLQISADAVILATGGASYPGTGSTGEGYAMAASAGHTLVPAEPALVPLVTAGNTAKRLQGISLRNVTVRVLIDGRRHMELFGEMLFTHFGVSGPVILTVSHPVVRALHEGKKAVIAIDLKPALDEEKLDARLIRDMNTSGKKQFRNLLKALLPLKMIPVCLDAVRIPEDKPANQISSEERRRLRTWLKDFRLDITGHRPLTEAIITAGGIPLKEVDPRTMQSRLVRGLFFAGEILDLNADTGGYNLQAAFSTGWLAGRNAAADS
ncbi:NAD(P)/FAD-dependent oxidoreductase [bacterium]|nr:NAD(P)/FAD-dependent oxidoreductase [bacterium]